MSRRKLCSPKPALAGGLVGLLKSFSGKEPPGVVRVEGTRKIDVKQREPTFTRHLGRPYALARTFLIEAACHWPPRGVGTPRALRAAAISLRDCAPALRTSLITGITLAACRSAAVFKAWTACLRAVASLGPPSFTPRALAAARGLPACYLWSSCRAATKPITRSNQFSHLTMSARTMLYLDC